VLIGPETYGQLPDGAVVEPRTGLRIKGKNEAVDAYVLLAPALDAKELDVHTELIEGITVRPLRNGETETVQQVFDRLGNRSRLPPLRRREADAHEPAISSISRAWTATIMCSLRWSTASRSGSRASCATAPRQRSPSRWPTSGRVAASAPS